MPTKPWHAGTYYARAEALRAAAYADPTTRCWRCKRMLHECKHRNGKPARWHAGHVVDSQVNGALLPECSPCSASSGAKYGNMLRRARRAASKALEATQTPTSARW